MGIDRGTKECIHPKGLNKRNHRFRERNLLKFIPDPHYLNLVFWGRELPDVKAGFRKGRGTRDQIADICWLMEKQENSRKKKSTSASTTKLIVVVWITTNCGKFLKRWEYQTTWPAFWETGMQVKRAVRTGHGTMDWERSMPRLV